jgi:ferredoxin-NADP reductase
MFNIHAYICGLNEMVSANRDTLKSLGWERKQIIFERYD